MDFTLLSLVSITSFLVFSRKDPKWLGLTCLFPSCLFTSILSLLLMQQISSNYWRTLLFFQLKKIFFHSLFSIYFLTTLNVMMYLHISRINLDFFNLVYESSLKNPWLSFQSQFLLSLLLVSSFLLWYFGEAT